MHLTDLLGPLLAVAAEETVTEPSNVGVGSVVLTVAAAAFLAWVGYLFLNSRRRAKQPEETPQNLQPYLSDDELETNRVTRVLNAAVVSAAVLAVAMPVYFLNEGSRQEAAAEKRLEKDVEEGEHWYEVFSCINCHGPDGGGGAAPFVEPRSGLDVAWTAPSINDVFLRYDEDEVRYWLNFGRAGTPMPVMGLPGGGSGTMQEVDQVIAYLKSFQIPQGQALDEVEGIVTDALARLETAEAAVARRIIEQQAELEDVQGAPDRFAVIEDFPTEVRFLLADDGTCTAESAAAVGSSCGAAGPDSDRDGLTDPVEERLSEIGAIVEENILVRQVVDQVDAEGAPVLDDEGNRIADVQLIPDPGLTNLYGFELNPNDAFTTTDLTGEPIPDLERAESFLLDLDTAHLTLGVTSERLDVFLERVEGGLEFLRNSAEEQLWEVDFDQVADEAGLSRAEAERAVGLFNGYCARCHTAGYQAGVAFQQSAGSGAWGPALEDGRSMVQFPDPEEQIQFIVRGSQANESYGVNGLGRGWMPGFGQILSTEDIALIVAYERTM